jgi:hypothetical protein
MTAENVSGRVDEIEARADDLEDFEHHVCGWASDQETAWSGTDLFFTFSDLYQPLRCPRF